MLLYLGVIEPTQLGLGTIKGNIDLEHVDQLYNDLKKGFTNKMLSNLIFLHYVCTPFDLSKNFHSYDFDSYAKQGSHFIFF